MASKALCAAAYFSWRGIILEAYLFGLLGGRGALTCAVAWYGLGEGSSLAEGPNMPMIDLRWWDTACAKVWNNW